MGPIPPGETLTDALLKTAGVTAKAFAQASKATPNRNTAILKDERGITGDTAIRL
jgi:plasmid maintenance system antidote protein VapI